MKNALQMPNGSNLTASKLEKAAVAVLCLTFVALVFSFLTSACSTSDETIHLPAGYTYLKWHDYRINPEHPPLVKMLAALPMLFRPVWPNEVQLREDDVAKSSFVSSGRLLRLSWAIALKYPNSQWNFCHQFLFGVTEKIQRYFGVQSALAIPTTTALAKSDFENDAGGILLTGRLMVLPLAIGLGLVIYLWARKLHGSAPAGLTALLLFTFDPNFIAHGGLVATDVPLAFFLTGALFFYWRLSHTFHLTTAVLFILFFSLAFVTKYSAVVLIPVYWVIGAGLIFRGNRWPGLERVGVRSNSTRSSKALFLLLLFTTACLVTWAVIWAFYGFRYAMTPDLQKTILEEEQALKVFPNLGPIEFRAPGRHPIEEEVRRATAIRGLLREKSEAEITEDMIKARLSTTPLGYTGQILLWVNSHHLLPAAYLDGFATADVASLLRNSYLRGQYSAGGFRTYFIWTFLLKTTLPALLAIAIGLYLVFRRKLSWTSDLGFLLIPVAVYFAMAVMTNMNIGHRHLLPIYPFLYIAAGLVGTEISRITDLRWRRCFQLFGIALVAVSSSVVFFPVWRPQLVFPHYLSYFNELAGGPMNGWYSLVDSNIDWGQDLKGLKKWLDKAQLAKPIYLCYFGTADPRYYQIIHVPAPKALGGYPGTTMSSASGDPISDFVNALQGGDYLAISVHNMVGPQLTPAARQMWKRILERCTLVDRIGYSIFVFRLDKKL